MAAIKDNRFLDIENYAKEWATQNIKEKLYDISLDQVKTSSIMYDPFLDTDLASGEINEMETEVVLARQRYENDVDEVQENCFTFVQTHSSSTRWTVNKGIKLGASADVRVGFPAAFNGRFNLNGQLNLSKAKEQKVESEIEWRNAHTVRVPPRRTVEATAFLKVQKITRDFTADVELTGVVRFIPKKKKTGEEITVSVQQLLANKDGFEELRDELGGGVKYKVTGTVEGAVGVKTDFRAKDITQETGNSEEKQDKQDGVTDGDQNAASPSNSDELVEPSVPNGARAAVSPPALDISRLEISQPTGSETEAVQPQDETDSTSVTAYDSPPTPATGYVVEDLKFGCLDSMAKLLDRCYVAICYWPHLAEKLDVSDEVREKIKCYSKNIHSPTEDLFNNLSATQPNLRVEEMLEALQKIGRFDVKKILEEQYAVIRNTGENITFKELAKKTIKIWSEMAFKLDSSEGALSGYKDLAEALGVPKEAFQQFGSDSRCNPTKGFFFLLKTGKSWTKVGDLKAIFDDMNQREVYDILCCNFQDDTEVANVHDNINVMERIAKVLNKSTGSDYPWKTLAGKLGYKEEDVCFLEPQEDAESPTKLVFDHLKQSRPKPVSLEKVIISLAEIGRYDVLKMMKERESKDFHGGYVDTVLRRADKNTTEGH